MFLGRFMTRHCFEKIATALTISEQDDDEEDDEDHQCSE